jgi:hypothetical protein
MDLRAILDDDPQLHATASRITQHIRLAFAANDAYAQTLSSFAGMLKDNSAFDEAKLSDPALMPEFFRSDSVCLCLCLCLCLSFFFSLPLPYHPSDTLRHHPTTETHSSASRR